MKKSINVLTFLFLILVLLSLVSCNKTEESNQPAVKSSATIVPAATLNAIETNKLAAQFSKDSPELANLLAEKRKIFKNNQEAITKKISELSKDGKATVEKELQLVNEITALSKTIADKNGVGADEQQAKRLKSQNELIELRKKKMELSRQIISTPEMKVILQTNSENVKALDDKISTLVNEIKAKKPSGSATDE